MADYKSLPFWENISRRKKLKKYQDNIEKYFSLVDFGNYTRKLIDNNKSRKIRTLLNKQSAHIQLYLIGAGISPFIVYTPPPAVGGYRHKINLVENLFNLFRYNIDDQVLVDTINKAIGVYERDFNKSILRTFCPLFWLGKLLEQIASIPFYLLGNLGFNREKIEASSFGKIIKFFVKFIFSLLAVLGADYALVGKNTLWTVNLIRSLFN